MKGHSRKAVKYAEQHGFRFERQNAKGVLYYRNDAGVEVGIPPWIDENGYRLTVATIDRACGVGPDLSKKRHPAEIKARQERNRQMLKAERARHAARLDELAREKAQVLLGGAGSALTLREVQAIERQIEAELRHHRDVVRQMTETPVGAA